MKTIKIKFCDFWKHWNEEDNFIVNVLKKKYKVEISDTPEYVFFSNFNDEFDHMDYNNCVKIFYTQENIVPDFNYTDYGIGFDYMSYEDRYFRYPIFLISERYGEAWDLMKIKHTGLNNETEILNRDFCSFVVSNGMAHKFRTEAFEGLSEYKPVMSGGRYLNNIGLPDGVPDKLEFTRKFKFSLCFENTSHPGYITEKLVEAFAAKTIPVYWGDPRVAELFNQEAFIDVTNCKTVEEVVEMVKRVDEDDELYLKMLSTPALREEEKDYYERTHKEFEAFLFHIFDQEPEKAIRRNLLFWGDTYHKRYNVMRQVFLKRKESKIYRIKKFLAVQYYDLRRKMKK